MTVGSAVNDAMDEVLERGEVGLQVAAYHKGELWERRAASKSAWREMS